MTGEINKNKIKALLKGELPGISAHRRMEPTHSGSLSNNKECRDAAVLLLLYEENQDLKIVFIKRNEYDGPHSGQISFPGGMKESSDIDLIATALREMEEEIGVPSSQIEILGKLSTLYISVSNFCVHPFVGWINSVPKFLPDKTEVQYIICQSLESLTDPANRKTGYFSRNSMKIKTPYIDIGGDMLWGATAMMLNEFIELLG